jgi:hypothetical protein
VRRTYLLLLLGRHFFLLVSNLFFRLVL